MVSEQQLDPSAKNLQRVAQGASDRMDRAVTKAERGYRAVPGKKPATAAGPLIDAATFVAALAPTPPPPAATTTKGYVGKSKFENATRWGGGGRGQQGNSAARPWRRPTELHADPRAPRSSPPSPFSPTPTLTRALSGNKTLVAAALKAKAAGVETARHGRKEWELDPSIAHDDAARGGPESSEPPKRCLSTSTPATRSRLAQEMRAKMMPARTATIRPRLQLEGPEWPGAGEAEGGGGSQTASQM